jgi:hypothetical protein
MIVKQTGQSSESEHQDGTRRNRKNGCDRQTREGTEPWKDLAHRSRSTSRRTRCRSAARTGSLGRSTTVRALATRGTGRGTSSGRGTSARRPGGSRGEEVQAVGDGGGGLAVAGGWGEGGRRGSDRSADGVRDRGAVSGVDTG